MKKRRNPSEKGQAIAKLIMEQYQPKTQEDMQIALKDVFGPIFEAMLQGEIDNHLGYSSNDHSKKETSNRRNGYTEKTIQTSVGEVPIRVPRDRESTFEPQVVPKRTKDVTGIESKVLAMYARGMSQRDIAKTIDDIYGFELSAESISNITDRVMDEVQHWQTRPLNPFYPFLFVDCLYVSVRKDYETKNHAVYVILGYDINGSKDVLGLWMNETEGKHNWMQIFDELKARGVEDVGFICMDGVSGLEEGAKSIFPQVVVQRCIVHLIRNSIKYIPSKDYKAYTTQLRKVYGAVNLKSAEAEFERFKQAWSQYPRCGRNMEAELAACPATIQLWQCRKEGDVYHQCDREREFQLPKSHQEGLVLQRGICLQGSLSQGKGTLCQVGRASYPELGDGQKPVGYG
jgi:transposase-like protein